MPKVLIAFVSAIDGFFRWLLHVHPCPDCGHAHDCPECRWWQAIK